MFSKKVETSFVLRKTKEKNLKYGCWKHFRMGNHGKPVKYHVKSFKYWCTGFSLGEKFWKPVNKALFTGL